ncbi:MULTISPECIES: hypothetical protein [unclassified Variovorax]|uniref:hypothetical protein n=1 Tax=unclassified Variovorax TaxID=663243 RepID=UPI00131788E9|nr:MULTISPECIES: hypothetical protein [unclassified Variovorax]VTU26714.1 hypothetical protein SRS16CHR_03913 [Variovorax sp. SRS16]VTU34538.1 hypothetical protein E5CHR_03839 [Variovorax sp. PBL-E5]
MIRVDPTLRTGEPPDDESDDALLGDGFDSPDADEAEVEAEAETTDELSEETGIDLTDASDLDADHVPADEDHDRVMQAPD